ncbi:hypothetical protein [Intrasporangium sp. DVR]|uniref:hypothetical protein n=1 Tax=Intrasporangium sp. DVR TaxID=3127867 RepID=UPI003340A2D2
MTTPMTPTAARPLPLRAPTPARRLLAAGVVVAAFLLTRGVAQAVTPFIRQDDWPFLLPPDTSGVLPTTYYNVSEGRWLNWAWWAVVGQHGTPTTAALTYAVGYALLVLGMWRALRLSGLRTGPVVEALLGLALFASCVWVQLLYWPGTLTPSVLMAAVAMWLLPWAGRSSVRLGLWLIVGEVSAVLTYPPIGAVLLVFAVVYLREAPWRRLLLCGATWLGAFALGVGVAYTLNWFNYGQFGLQLAKWRRPNPLTSLDALAVNAERWFEAAGTLWAAQWWTLLVGFVGIALGWGDATVRPRLQRLLLAFVLAYGLDAAQTLATGVVTEARGQLWTWLLAVLPVALLLIERHDVDPVSGARRRHHVHRIATVLLTVLAVGGVVTWRADIGAHQATRMQYASIAEAATAHAPGTDAPRIVVYQDPSVRETREGRIMASTLFMAVRQELGGVLPGWCRGWQCGELAARAGSESVIRLANDVVGIVVPAPPDWL